MYTPRLPLTLVTLRRHSQLAFHAPAARALHDAPSCELRLDLDALLPSLEDYARLDAVDARVVGAVAAIAADDLGDASGDDDDYDSDDSDDTIRACSTPASSPASDDADLDVELRLALDKHAAAWRAPQRGDVDQSLDADAACDIDHSPRSPPRIFPSSPVSM